MLAHPLAALHLRRHGMIVEPHLSGAWLGGRS